MIDPQVEELLEHSYISQVENGPPAGEFPAEVLDQAQRQGLVNLRPGGWDLTDAGRLAARDVVRRHRLAECLLRDVLAVGADQIDQDACRFEHILRPGLDDRVCALLGHPTSCPHGQPIPPGQCCQAARADALREFGPLSAGEVGAEGVVAYLSTRDLRDVQKLMAIGILPGVRIRLDRRFPSFVFQVGFSQFTVDRELADKIVVHWQDATPAGPRRARRRHGR